MLDTRLYRAFEQRFLRDNRKVLITYDREKKIDIMTCRKTGKVLKPDAWYRTRGVILVCLKWFRMKDPKKNLKLVMNRQIRLRHLRDL